MARRGFSLTIALSVLLLLCTDVVRPQDADNVEFDTPGSERVLNKQLWEFARGTPYESIEAYVVEARQKSREAMSNDMELPTGWKLNPAGSQVQVGRLPYEAILYNGKLVVLNTGYYYKEPQEISIVDPERGTVIKTDTLSSLFPCAKIGFDGNLYISGGFDCKIYSFDRSFKVEHEYRVGGYAAGMAPVDSNHLAVLYLVANDSQGNYGEGKIALLNLRSERIENERNVGYFPYAVEYVKGKFYVTVLGENKLKIYDSGLNELRSLPVGNAPFNLTVQHNYMYIINSISDNITVVDTRYDVILEKIFVGRKRYSSGVSPTSCAIDGDKIYVSEATLNAVAVYRLIDGKFLGYIPTGWYTTKVLLGDGKLFYLSAKGILRRRANPNGPQPVENKGGPDYVLTLLRGTVGIVPVSSIENDLHEWTRVVKEGSPVYSPEKGIKVPIKHIFYIVKENRSYDQVLGDLGRGNGDSTLTIFGWGITPNIHKLAKEFVTLDNFYADGEISVLGHSFTTSGYASPFLEWLGNASYSGRYRGYPFGTVPAVFSKTYIWDALNAKGVDYKIYGEPYYLMTAAYRIIVDFFGKDSAIAKKFYANSMELAAKVDRGTEFSNFVRQYYGKASSLKGALRLLGNAAFAKGISKTFTGDLTLYRELSRNYRFRKAFAEFLYHYPLNYYTWDLKYSDLKRYEAWRIDFESQVKSGRVVPFEYIWLPNDHTGGTNPNYQNPYQLVAQNDIALGLIVQTISNSPIWKNSLILVEEDDAQNGPDHVDATRTEALAAGPFVKRDVVVHDRYDQLSMLRTIEIILNLDPLSFEDAMAVPMFGIFTSKPDMTRYDSAPPSEELSNSDKSIYEKLIDERSSGREE
jgi:hypothetical protein